jgi:hypothetical protein
MTDRYVIIECNTGLMDGIYYGYEVALGSFRGWRAERPERTHMLCRMEDVAGPHADWVIPDHLFLAANRDNAA